MLGREANFVLKRLAQSISIKWEKPLGQTTGWLHAKLSFAILRATNLCLRGSRTKWRSGVEIDDGAGLQAELPKSDEHFIVSFCCCFSVRILYLYYNTCNLTNKRINYKLPCYINFLCMSFENLIEFTKNMQKQKTSMLKHASEQLITSSLYLQWINHFFAGVKRTVQCKLLLLGI